MSANSNRATQAKNYAFRLLNYRERSVKEIEDRLIRKGFNKEVCAKTVADLKALKLVDDHKFAKSFAEGRVKYKPSGLALIRSKLYFKGIAEETINSVITDIEKGYDEYHAAYEIAARKTKSFSKISREKAKRRIYEYLLRRRFKKDIIFKVLNKIFESKTD
jgi:regulatory protein